jgi:hypothetical protein
MGAVSVESCLVVEICGLPILFVDIQRTELDRLQVRDRVDNTIWTSQPEQQVMELHARRI